MFNFLESHFFLLFYQLSPNKLLIKKKQYPFSKKKKKSNALFKVRFFFSLQIGLMVYIVCVKREREREPSPVNSDTITCFIVDINISLIAFADMNCWSREPIVYSKHCLVATKPFKICVLHLQPERKIFKSNTIR